MTRRARRLLDAIEAGCETRKQIFDHQDGFSLLNNAAAELRAAGIDVECEYSGGDYRYRLLRDDGRIPTPIASGVLPAPVISEQSGQLTWEIAA